MSSKKITVIYFLFIISITGIADQVIDTNFFLLDKIVNNDFIRKNANKNAPDYFDNFFAIDAVKYDAGDYYYGIGICKGKNCAYYFDMRMKSDFYAINMDLQVRALQYVDKTAVTNSGKIYIVDETGTVYILKDGDMFNKVAEIPLNDICLTAPSVADGLIVFRTQGYLIGVGKK